MPLTHAATRLRLIEPAVALVVALLAFAVIAADLSAAQVPVINLPTQTALVAVAATAMAWAYAFARLLLTEGGRRFLVRSLPARRASLTAVEQPNTLTVSALVLAAVVFLPPETDNRASTILVGALALLLASWVAGNSARYRMGALLLSESMFWIGLCLLALGIAHLSEPLFASASNSARLASLFVAAYAVSIAAGTVRTAARWTSKQNARRARQLQT